MTFDMPNNEEIACLDDALSKALKLPTLLHGENLALEVKRFVEAEGPAVVHSRSLFLVSCTVGVRQSCVAVRIRDLLQMAAQTPKSSEIQQAE